MNILEREYNFKNQSVVITGGGSGIGKAIALAFLEAKADVVIAGRNLKKLRNTAKQLSLYGNCEVIKLDVSDAAAAKNAVNRVIKKYKKISILINCAGVYGPMGKFHENSINDWREAISINLLGTANMAHAVLPFMLRQRSGKIINLSGGGAVQPFPNFSAYATSKAAVVRLTENLAKEYEHQNIQVNAIAPGAVNTQFLAKVLKAGPKKAGKDFFSKSLAQKKTGGDDPKIAADLVLFLASSKLTGKLVSAKWDNWKKWQATDIARINKTDGYTLRRIDNKYFKEI